MFTSIGTESLVEQGLNSRLSANPWGVTVHIKGSSGHLMGQEPGFENRTGCPEVLKGGNICWRVNLKLLWEHLL